MDRVTQFAVAAAKLAVEDAELDLEKIDPVRAGVCVGSGIGGIHTFLEQSLKYGEKGPGKISPFFIPMEIPNMPAGQISIALALKALIPLSSQLVLPALTVSATLCALFNMAMPIL